MKELLDLIRVFNNAANDRGASWQPTLPLEMAFLEGLEVINKEGAVAEKIRNPQPKAIKGSPKPAQVTPQEQTPSPEGTPTIENRESRTATADRITAMEKDPGMCP